VAHRRTITIKRLHCADVLCRQQQPRIRLKVPVHSTVTYYSGIQLATSYEVQSYVWAKKLLSV